MRRPPPYPPPWRRMILEGLAGICVYLAVLFLFGNYLWAILAMLFALMVLRFTRPKPQEPPR